MAYLYSDLITDFRNIMRDPSTLSNKLFTDAEILIWAGDANMELAREVGLNIFQTSLTVQKFSGVLTEARTIAGGPYTTIKVGTSSGTPNKTGILTVSNGTNDESIGYYDWSLATAVYTFSINSWTPENNYAISNAATSPISEYAFPTSCVKIIEVRNADGEKILPTTITELDAFDEDWKDKSGDIDYWYPAKDATYKIGFYKAPSATETIVVRAWKLPVSSAAAASLATSSTPEVEESLTKLLLDYTLFRGYQKKRDFSVAERHYDRFYKVNIPNARKFIFREEDRLLGLRSNEQVNNRGMGRLPDGYPVMTRY